jgi:hypothetical protein
MTLAALIPPDVSYKETTMNLRCSYCQTPFSIGRVEKIAALQHMYAENLTHYDAHCPRCRRSSPVLRQKLETTMPNWRDQLKELEKELKAHPQQEAPLPKPEPASAPPAESKPEPKTESKPSAKPKPAKPAGAKAKPAAKKKGK